MYATFALPVCGISLLPRGAPPPLSPRHLAGSGRWPDQPACSLRTPSHLLLLGSDQGNKIPVQTERERERAARATHASRLIHRLTAPPGAAPAPVWPMQAPSSLEERVALLSDAAVGDIGSRYKLGEELGSGAQATVYRGVSKKTGGKVAIKVLDSKDLEDDELFEALRMEITLLKQLQHPYIVNVTEVVRDNSRLYIVQECLDAGRARASPSWCALSACRPARRPARRPRRRRRSCRRSCACSLPTTARSTASW